MPNILYRPSQFILKNNKQYHKSYSTYNNNNNNNNNKILAFITLFVSLNYFYKNDNK